MYIYADVELELARRDLLGEDHLPEELAWQQTAIIATNSYYSYKLSL